MTKQLTPMKKLNFNLNLLKEQLSSNFNVIELTERSGNSYRNSISSDYLLLFTSKQDKNKNFAFDFLYKNIEENQYVIEITTKNESGEIYTIKKFSYEKFKEILNNLVKLNFTDDSIFDYVLLMKNVKDEIYDKITNTDILVEMDLEFEEFINKSNKARIETLLKEKKKIDTKVYKEYINSVEFKNVERLEQELGFARKAKAKKLDELMLPHKEKLKNVDALEFVFRRESYKFIVDLYNKSIKSTHKTNKKEIDKRKTEYENQVKFPSIDFKFTWR